MIKWRRRRCRVATPRADMRVGYCQSIYALLDGVIADGVHLGLGALPVRVRRYDG